MKLVMGELNRVWLRDLLAASRVSCRSIHAAVAYAQDNHLLFEHCKEHEVRLWYFGLLDESDAVPVALLERLLSRGPSRVECRLVHGNFHPKVIWWHGYGAYIGSANLTDKAWSRNVECGVFYDEDELSDGIGQQLENLFDYLLENSLPLTAELIQKLKRFQSQRASLNKAKTDAMMAFGDLMKGVPEHRGLSVHAPKGHDHARDRFVAEWTKTLELLRGLGKEFHDLKARPAWVDDSADPVAHFDQFLHAYYYAVVLDRDGDEGKSVERVERFYERHRHDAAAAMRDAAAWWAGLSQPPLGEDDFIRLHAPQMRNAFRPESLAALTKDSFPNAIRRVNAFRMHARQTKNSELGLPHGFSCSEDERVDYLARWLWDRRTVSGKSVRDLLEFVIWGTRPRDMEERLWLAISSDEWALPHFGRSSIGELVGWARSDLYPPRNNRTNKALRALGHNVKLYYSD